VAVGALAVTFGGWLIRQANLVERIMMGIAGLAMLYADLGADAVGFGLFLVGLLIHVVRVRQMRQPESVAVVATEAETLRER
jgi:TRAP-type uncharacterized transport system fused permease subunit